MMKLWDEYFFADSISHGLEILNAFSGAGRVMAGGTDLILRIKDRTIQARCIVDITRIEGLDEVSDREDKTYIGATLTHSQVIINNLIREQLPLLVEASSHVGTPQVRNQATILGNVINAQPAADTAVALLALDAEACIQSKKGIRWEPIGDLYEGVGASRVDATSEIATAVRCRTIQKGEGWAYFRIKGRNDHWLPTLNGAIWVSVDQGKILSIRIVIGPVAPRLFRARNAEGLLIGSDISLTIIERASKEAMKEAHPRDSILRGLSDYRKELVRVMTRRGILLALKRAGVDLEDL